MKKVMGLFVLSMLLIASPCLAVIDIDISGSTVHINNSKILTIHNMTSPELPGAVFWVQFTWDPLDIVFVPTAAGLESTTPEPSVKVFKDSGSKVCSGGGVSPDVMQYELINAGIEVRSFSCGYDGMVHCFACGVCSSGGINIFEIPQSQVAQAQSIGYVLLSTLPNARERQCPTNDTNHAPQGRNLTIPTGLYPIGLSNSTFTIYYEYSDPDGLDDVKTHHILMSDGSNITFAAQGAGIFNLGGFYFDTKTMSKPLQLWVEVYVTDAAGAESNHIRGSIGMCGDLVADPACTDTVRVWN